MSVATAERASYRRLFGTPGLIPLFTATLLTRTSIQMWEIGVVLFAISRFHSPTVAGLGVFLLVFPGLATSPLSGALLDRFGRKRLMSLDFTVAIVCLTAIVVLAVSDHLPAWLLLLILAIGSTTSSLSFSGTRSLFPLMVPAALWDRANGVDSLCYGLAQIAGPGLAGVLTASFGGPAALAAAAIGYLFAIAALSRVPEPRVARDVSASVLRDAWQGIGYVLRNRTLRWIAAAISTSNIAFGILIVALPLLVFRLHGDAAVVGAVFALQGAVAVPAALFGGRLRTLGRERQIMALTNALIAVTSLALLIPSMAALAFAVAVAGFAQGPANVAMFSLRQRSTDRAWFGRAFAISMSLNFAGQPLGSALSGPIVNSSLTLAIVLVALLSAASGVMVLKLIPASTAAGR
jgi:MFS family permease